MHCFDPLHQILKCDPFPHFENPPWRVFTFALLGRDISPPLHFRLKQYCPLIISLFTWVQKLPFPSPPFSFGFRNDPFPRSPKLYWPDVIHGWAQVMGPMGKGAVDSVLGAVPLGVCLMDADSSFVVAQVIPPLCVSSSSVQEGTPEEGRRGGTDKV